MAAARALGVEGVDGAALEGVDGVLDKTRLVERVGVDHHLDVELVRDVQAVVDGRGRRAPVLVQLERAGASEHHFLERGREGGVALARECEVHREILERTHHVHDVPGAGAGRRERAMRRAGAAAEHRRDARHQGFFDLLGRNEMDVGVHAAGGEDLAFAGDNLGRGADDDCDTRLRVGISRLADRLDAPVLETDIGLVDAGDIDDQGVGDHGIDCAFGARRLRLAHAVADHLAAAELHLFAVGREVLLHLDEELGIGQPHLVAGGRAIHVGVGRAGESCGHRSAFRGGGVSSRSVRCSCARRSRRAR
jgi:hypothetical protein